MSATKPDCVTFVENVLALTRFTRMEGPEILHHVDLYRLEDESELDGIGFDDLFADGAVLAVDPAASPALDLAEQSGKPVLVDVWAPWCGPCRAMAPAFAEAAGQLEPAVRVAKLNTDEEQAIGARFGIRSIPTMLLFRGGREVARQSGAMMAGDIVRWVRSNLVTAH